MDLHVSFSELTIVHSDSTHWSFHDLNYFCKFCWLFWFYNCSSIPPLLTITPLLLLCVPASESRHHLLSSLTFSSLPACCPTEDCDSKSALNGKDVGEEAQTLSLCWSLSCHVCSGCVFNSDFHLEAADYFVTLKPTALFCNVGFIHCRKLINLLVFCETWKMWS